MNIHEAKKDAKKRLEKYGVKYRKIVGRTMDFQDLARESPIFINVYGVGMAPPGTLSPLHEGIPKPSRGSYILKVKEK